MTGRAATQFRSGPENTGRPKGARNKVLSVQRALALDEFAPLWPVAKAKIVRHFALHQDEAKDCATCRHYVTMVAEYVFGKPVQPITERADVEAMLEALGVRDPDAVEKALRVAGGIRLVK